MKTRPKPRFQDPLVQQLFDLADELTNKSNIPEAGALLAGVAIGLTMDHRHRGIMAIAEMAERWATHQRKLLTEPTVRRVRAR